MITPGLAIGSTTTYWNAFVAVLEMHGVGNFYDPRLDNTAKYPIAAANGFLYP